MKDHCVKMTRLFCHSMELFATLLLAVYVETQDTILHQNTTEKTSSSFWAKLQISPNILGSIKYANFQVNIFEHLNNQNPNIPFHRHKYYYAPVAIFGRESVVCNLDNHEVVLSPWDQHCKDDICKENKPPLIEMQFGIEMWNENVTNAVASWLTEFFNDGSIYLPNQVHVIPLENVILASSSPSSLLYMSTDWKQFRNHVSFHFPWSSETDCIHIREGGSSRGFFDDFKLLFSLSPLMSQTKKVTIRKDSVTSGETVTRLLQEFSQDKTEIFLLPDDDKKILMEATRIILLDNFNELELVSPSSIRLINVVLKDLLFYSKTNDTREQQSDDIWESVFWNNDNRYRPDKTAQTLNDVYKKIEEESQKILVDIYKPGTETKHCTTLFIHEFITAISESCSVNATCGPFTLKKNLATEFSRHGSASHQGLFKFFEKSRCFVQWNGEKFVPYNPVQFTRINLTKFRDSQPLQDRCISVRYTTAVMPTPVNLVTEYQVQLTGEWKLFKEKLFETDKLLKRTRRELRNKLNNTTAVVEDLTTKLNETEKLLKRTRRELRNKLNNTTGVVEDLTTKLNARTKDIADIGKMPSSCSDLERMGHQINGFFSVKGSEKIETVYCDFHSNETAKQKWIGYSDVKSTPVYFYVQRKLIFNKVNVSIPFHIARINIGEAMNLTSGIFTAPNAGTYFFSFTGLASYPASNGTAFLGIGFFLNGNYIGRAWIHENNVTFHNDNPITLQLTLKLKKADKISLKIVEISPGALLYDDDRHFTHFTGFMLEQDII